MNIKLFIIFLAFLVFFSSVIYAAPLPPSPVCEIEAEIINVKISEESTDIKVLSIGEMIEEGYQPLYENFSCQEYENERINDVVMRTEGNYRSGQKIKAEISYVGDEFSEGYVLDNVIILTEPEDEDNGINILYYLVLIIIIITLWLIIKKKRPGS
jgi:hypothetical protein